MFGHGPFFNNTIRRHVIVLGTMLNQIHVQRTNDDGEVTGVIRVPIVYGPKDKALNRFLTDETLTRPFSSIIPFMSFEMVRMSYDSERQLPKINKMIGRSQTGSKDHGAWLHNPVPYNFEFQVNLMVKNVADGWKIIEQIAPWFSPDWTVTVKLIDDPLVALDIKTLLDPIEQSDNYSEGSYGDNRFVTWTLNFLMQGYLFGPTRKSKIIKRVDTNFQFTPGVDYLTLTVTPGMTEGGDATDDPDETVPYSEIDWDDDFGFVVERELSDNR